MTRKLTDEEKSAKKAAREREIANLKRQASIVTKKKGKQSAVNQRRAVDTNVRSSVVSHATPADEIKDLMAKHKAKKVLLRKRIAYLKDFAKSLLKEKEKSDRLASLFLQTIPANEPKICKNRKKQDVETVYQVLLNNPEVRTLY